MGVTVTITTTTTTPFFHLSHVNHYYPQKQNLSFFPPKKLTPTTKCAFSKKGQRFLNSISTIPFTTDPSAAQLLIHKFISSSSKLVTLNTLNHLISPQSPHLHLHYLALPLYMGITRASWFSWNSKLVAKVVAFLYKQGKEEEAEFLILETVSSFCSNYRVFVSFYCNVIDSSAKLKSEDGFSATFNRLKEISSRSSSIYVKKRAYESMIGGLCLMDRPHEAGELISEMRQLGIRPSLFEFRSMIEGYGRLGLFEEMLQTAVDMESIGLALDMITSNMIFRSYGLHNELSQMVLWMRNVKGLGIKFSIRTYNSVLNSCPTIMSLLQDLRNIPISLEELLLVLKGNEALLVQELVGSLGLDEIITWSPLESNLDLHKMPLSTAYFIMLQWMEDLRCRFSSGECKVPAEIIVVCGWGKHSSVKGESPVKALVKEIMLRTRSPLRVDRKNIGCFIAKGKTVKEWLCAT